MKKSVPAFLIYFSLFIASAHAQQINSSATYRILFPINSNSVMHWPGRSSQYNIEQLHYSLKPLPTLDGLIAKFPGLNGIDLNYTSSEILDDQLETAAKNNNGTLWGKLLISHDSLSGLYHLTLQFDAFPGKFYKGSPQNLEFNPAFPIHTAAPDDDGACHNSWCLPGGFPTPSPFPPNVSGCTSDWCGQVN